MRLTNAPGKGTAPERRPSPTNRQAFLTFPFLSIRKPNAWVLKDRLRCHTSSLPAVPISDMKKLWSSKNPRVSTGPPYLCTHQPGSSTQPILLSPEQSPTGGYASPSHVPKPGLQACSTITRHEMLLFSKVRGSADFLTATIPKTNSRHQTLPVGLLLALRETLDSTRSLSQLPLCLCK
jgi:hypothetical protein